MSLKGRLTLKKETSLRKRAWYNCKDIFLWKVRHALQYRWREWPLEVVLLWCRLLKLLVPGLLVPMHGRLYIQVTRPHFSDGSGPAELWDYGMVGVHLITTAGKNAATGYWNASTTAGLFKFHGYGIGVTAAALGDIALQSELTVQYATDNTRPTGSQVVSTNVYTTVASLAPDVAGTGGVVSVTEWGLFSQAANSGGTLFDHQVFSVISLNPNADSLQTTYNLTVG
jgi:hypothetical protein